VILLKEHAEEFFNRRAGFWDVKDIPKNAGELSRILIQKAEIKEGEKVLDLATGTGFQAVQITFTVGRRGKVYGTDISVGMLKEAKEKIKKLGLKEIIELCRADAENLPFKNNLMDAVICGFSYHHFPNPYKVAEEIYRVLKPKRKAVIVDGCRPTWSHLKKIIVDLYVKIKDRSRKVRFYSEEEFRKFFKQAKFHNIHTWSFYQIHTLICPFVIIEAEK